MKKSTIRQQKYDKNNTVRYGLKLNIKTDKDLIEAIGDKNKQTKIKELLRKGLKYED